jgi:hypothetical protein
MICVRSSAKLFEQLFPSPSLALVMSRVDHAAISSSSEVFANAKRNRLACFMAYGEFLALRSELLNHVS